jgi:hypothetical protein
MDTIRLHSRDGADTSKYRTFRRIVEIEGRAYDAPSIIVRPHEDPTAAYHRIARRQASKHTEGHTIIVTLIERGDI